MSIYRIEERLDQLIDEIENDTPTQGQIARMEGLNSQMVELQKMCRKKMSKILKPDMEFSGPVKMCHERVQAYKALIKWKEGRPRNGNDIIRMALWRGIKNLRQLLLKQMKDGGNI